MALTVEMNNVVEGLTHRAFYENFFPKLKHINGKGVAENFLVTTDPTSCNTISVPRILPIKPHYRTLGSSNNGGWKNTKNYNGGSEIESTAYDITLNHVFDETTHLAYNLVSSNNGLDFKQAITSVISDSFASTLNMFTWASQIYAFFRDNSSISDSVFTYDGTSVSASQAFLNANASLANGDISIGALAIPSDKCQAFVTTSLNSAIKSQYSTNASDLATMINATGFTNPFTQTSGTRVSAETGLCGLYDGVVMTLITTGEWGYVIENLGATGTVATLLGYVQGFIVYAGGTIRGCAGLDIQVGDDPDQYKSLVIKPYAKFGVGVLSGKTIKLITNKALTNDNLATIKAGISIADGISSVGDGTNYAKRA